MQTDVSNRKNDIPDDNALGEDVFIIDRTGGGDDNTNAATVASDNEAKEASTTNQHGKRPHRTPQEEAKLAKNRQRKLYRMFSRHQKAAAEHEEACRTNENKINGTPFIPPTMFGLAKNPFKYPYNGIELPEPLSVRSSTPLVVYADSFTTQVTNALLAVETTIATQQDPPSQQQTIYDRAGLDLLLLLHRIQRLPFTRDALQEILVQYVWSTPSWQHAVEMVWRPSMTTMRRNEVPTVDTIDRLETLLVDHFLHPGGFCIMYETNKKNRYQSRIHWNPQWTQFILIQPLPPHNEAAANATTAGAAVAETTTVGAVTATSSTAESPTTVTSTDDDDVASHMIHCFLAAAAPSSFPADRLQFQRKLGILRAAAATPALHVDEMTLLRGWIRQGCLAVAPNGAFTWNMGALPPQAAPDDATPAAATGAVNEPNGLTD